MMNDEDIQAEIRYMSMLNNGLMGIEKLKKSIRE